MVGWHHRFSEHEFGQTRTDSEGQGGLASCSPRGSQRAGHGLVTEQQQQTEGQENIKQLVREGPRAQTQAILLQSLGRHSREVRENTVSQKSH